MCNFQNSDSILNYVVGEVSREAGGTRPEYLPYGYLVGDTTSISLHLASYSSSSDFSRIQIYHGAKHF